MSNIKVEDIIYGNRGSAPKFNATYSKIDFGGAIASENAKTDALIGAGVQVATVAAKAYDNYSQMQMTNALMDAEKEAKEAGKAAVREFNSYVGDGVDPNKAGEIVSEKYRKEMERVVEANGKQIAPYLQDNYRAAMKDRLNGIEATVQDGVIAITDGYTLSRAAESLQKAVDNLDWAAGMAVLNGMKGAGIDAKRIEDLYQAYKRNFVYYENQENLKKIITEDPTQYKNESNIESKITNRPIGTEDESMLDEMRSHGLIPTGVTNETVLSEGDKRDLMNYAKRLAFDVSEENRKKAVFNMEGVYSSTLTSVWAGRIAIDDMNDAERTIRSALSPHNDKDKMLDQDAAFSDKRYEELVEDFMKMFMAQDGGGVNDEISAANLFAFKKQYREADEAGRVSLFEQAISPSNTSMNESDKRKVWTYVEGFDFFDTGWHILTNEQLAAMDVVARNFILDDPEMKKAMHGYIKTNLGDEFRNKILGMAIGGDKGEAIEQAYMDMVIYKALERVDKYAGKLNEEGRRDYLNNLEKNFAKEIKFLLHDFVGTAQDDRSARFGPLKLGKEGGAISPANAAQIEAIKVNDTRLSPRERDEVISGMLTEADKGIKEAIGTNFTPVGTQKLSQENGLVWNLYSDKTSGKKYWATLDRTEDGRVFLTFREAENVEMTRAGLTADAPEYNGKALTINDVLKINKKAEQSNSNTGQSSRNLVPYTDPATGITEHITRKERREREVIDRTKAVMEKLERR